FANCVAAEVIALLYAPFLCAGFPGMTRYAREFAKRRDPDSGTMSRLYVVESTLTSTGAKADHRLPMRAGQIEDLARLLMASQPAGVSPALTTLGPEQIRFAAAVGRDLLEHRSSSAVIAGEHQSPAVHALAHAINPTFSNV